MLIPEGRKRVKFWLDVTLGIIGLGAIASFIAIIGFELTAAQTNFFLFIKDFVIVIFIIQEVFRWIFAIDKLQYAKERWFETLIIGLLVFEFVFPDFVLGLVTYFFPELLIQEITLLYLAIIEVSIIYVLALKLLRHSHSLARINLHPGAIFALSFALIILIGSLWLMLPKATRAGYDISFVDALFTSTSAVCVTGLTVIDTAKDYTLLGQVIIMLLIQIGGLGVMTLTTFFALFSGGISFKMRVMMRDLLSNENIGEVTGLLVRITAFTLSIEFIGAVCLYFSQGGSLFNINSSLIFPSIFHSVSAFCNAGFALFTLNLAEPGIQTNYFFNSTIMMLIVLGGIGFGVLSNLYDIPRLAILKKRKLHRLSVTSKVAILTTIILIIGGGLLIYIFEPYSFDYSMSIFDKLFHSMFLSVTSRTAGFNTVPMETLIAPTAMVIILLMWIGASPGSTGGGVKTTTFFVATYSLFNLIRGKERFEIFKRQIPNDIIHRSFLIIFSSLMVLCIGCILLTWIEPDKSALNLVFEAFSAVGTVGLTLGITSKLGDGGKIVIILLMYIGRIGALTFFLAFYKPQPEPRYSLPKEQIMIG